jgi:hypothetical protein
MAAPPRYDFAANESLAAEALLALALIDAVTHLKLAPIAIRIHVIRDRRAAQSNRFREHVAYGAIEAAVLLLRKIRSHSPRVDARPPQALIRVYVSDATQHALIEQQRLHPRLPRANLLREFLLAHHSGIDKDIDMVSTFSHELEHDLDPGSISAIKDRQEGRSNDYDVEAPAHAVGAQVEQEMRDNKKPGVPNNQ